jgi:hypothetical protein
MEQEILFVAYAVIIYLKFGFWPSECQICPVGLSSSMMNAFCLYTIRAPDDIITY